MQCADTMLNFSLGWKNPTTSPEVWAHGAFHNISQYDPSITANARMNFLLIVATQIRDKDMIAPGVKLEAGWLVEISGDDIRLVQ